MKLALAQMNIIWENPSANWEKIESFFNKAAVEKADIIIFPEMSITGFSMKHNIFIEDKDCILERLKNLCARFCINAGVGYAYMQGLRAKNCFSVVTLAGQIVLDYEKIHLFSHAGEDVYFESGNRLAFAKIGDFCVSCFICYDLRFPELFLAASKKADIIIVAANWPECRDKQWRTLLSARAIENQCFIAAVNRVGDGGGIAYCGSSMIIDPQGKIITEISSDEMLIVKDLDISDMIKIREKFDTKKDRRDSIYKSFYSDSEI